MRNSGTVWTIAKRTVPLCAAKCALHDGFNISVCENNSGFLRPGHIWFRIPFATLLIINMLAARSLQCMQFAGSRQGVMMVCTI